MEAVSGGSASPSGESKPAPGEKDEIIEPEQDLSQASVQSASAIELEQKAEIPSFSDLSIDTQGKSFPPHRILFHRILFHFLILFHVFEPSKD